MITLVIVTNQRLSSGTPDALLMVERLLDKSVAAPDTGIVFRAYPEEKYPRCHYKTYAESVVEAHMQTGLSFVILTDSGLMFNWFRAMIVARKVDNIDVKVVFAEDYNDVPKHLDFNLDAKLVGAADDLQRFYDDWFGLDGDVLDAILMEAR